MNFFLKAVKMIEPFERKIDRKILGPMQAKGCGILDRHTSWRFTKCMMVMHSLIKVLDLKTCSGMAKNIMGGYFGRRSSDRQPIWNDAV